jgi:hypothetical protein
MRRVSARAPRAARSTHPLEHRLRQLGAREEGDGFASGQLAIPVHVRKREPALVQLGRVAHSRRHGAASRTAEAARSGARKTAKGAKKLKLRPKSARSTPVLGCVRSAQAGSRCRAARRGAAGAMSSNPLNVSLGAGATAVHYAKPTRVKNKTAAPVQVRPPCEAHARAAAAQRKRTGPAS